MPQNYDHKFRGPISLRNALAQSINIPSIKTLYLAGIRDTIQTAQDMGITSLTDPNRYGLTLVLGGGEVSLLEMTSAYGVFSQDGIRNPHTPVLKVTDRNGKVLEEFTPNPQQVIPAQPAMLINDILHDNNARLPLNGPGSPTDFPNREIALKTGTTNDARDAWIIGYTPHLVVGTWAGNNDNSPMIRKPGATSGLIVAPMWREFMDDVLTKVPEESFNRPDPIDPNLKPILRGIWQGNQTYTIDKSSGNLATDFTPRNFERSEQCLMSTPFFIGLIELIRLVQLLPSRKRSSIQIMGTAGSSLGSNKSSCNSINPNPPTQIDMSHTPEQHHTSFSSPSDGQTFSKNSSILASINFQSSYPLSKVEFYLNDTLIGTASAVPIFRFISSERY
jgi:membrane peptidoglycan carboxypeptidase